MASLQGREGVVKLLLATRQVVVDSKDNLGGTPLLSAIWEGHEGVVKLLLETEQVDINRNEPRTPIGHAAMKGSETIVNLLLEIGQVHIDAKDNWSDRTRYP